MHDPFHFRALGYNHPSTVDELSSMLQRWMDTGDLDLEDKIVVVKKEAEEFATGMGFLFYEVSVKIYNCKRSRDNLLGNAIIKHE